MIGTPTVSRGYCPFPELLKQAISKGNIQIDKNVGKVILDEKVREAFKSWKTEHRNFVCSSPLMGRISKQIDNFEKKCQMTKKNWGFAELKQTGFLTIEGGKAEEIEEGIDSDNFYKKVETENIFKNPEHKFDADQWLILNEYYEVGYFSDLQYQTLLLKKQAKNFIYRDEIAEELFNQSKTLRTFFGYNTKDTQLKGFYLDSLDLENSYEIFQVINGWAKQEKWKKEEFSWDEIEFYFDDLEGMVKVADFLHIPKLLKSLDERIMVFFWEKLKIIVPEDYVDTDCCIKLDKRKDYSEQFVEENGETYWEALNWLKAVYDNDHLLRTKNFLCDFLVEGLFADKKRKPELYEAILAELPEDMKSWVIDKIEEKPMLIAKKIRYNAYLMAVASGHG